MASALTVLVNSQHPHTWPAPLESPSSHHASRPPRILPESRLKCLTSTGERAISTSADRGALAAKGDFRRKKLCLMLRRREKLQMDKKNCWHVKKCGRQPGGENVEGLGECPAAHPNDYDGVNRGRHGGRFCWSVAGTFCGGTAQGTYSKKIVDCLRCEFLKQVERDEGRNFILTPQEAIAMRDLGRGI